MITTLFHRPLTPPLQRSQASGERLGVYALALLLLLVSPLTLAGTILVTDAGAPSPITCTLAQAIHAANLANSAAAGTNQGLYLTRTEFPGGPQATANSGSQTTSGGSCSGATAGANSIAFGPAVAGQTITFAAADNWWFGPNALPPIASEITIDGGVQGVTLKMDFSGWAAGVTRRLRFFYVGVDPRGTAVFPADMATPGAGQLTLRNLTLEGGRQQGGSSGGVGGALGGLAALSRVTLAHLAVGGPLYGEIAQSKDLVADITPPPLYIIESYLVAHEIARHTEQARRDLREAHAACPGAWSWHCLLYTSPSPRD